MPVLTVKVMKPLLNKKPGEILNLELDRDGVVVDRYWRERLEDSRIDGCLEVQKQNPESVKGMGKNKKESE